MTFLLDSLDVMTAGASADLLDPLNESVKLGEVESGASRGTGEEASAKIAESVPDITTGFGTEEVVSIVVTFSAETSDERSTTTGADTCTAVLAALGITA